MSRSPIDIMIDTALGITKPFPPREFITLRCPTCGKEQRVEKADYDPPKAVVMLLDCPHCQGDALTIRWLDTDGRDVA